MISAVDRDAVTAYVEELELFRDIIAPAERRAAVDSCDVYNRALQFQVDYLLATRPRWYEDPRIWFALGAGMVAFAASD